MLDIASVGFSADSRQLRQTRKDLDDMGKSGKDAGREIKGLEGVARKGFGAVALAATAAVGALASLGTAIQTIQEFDRSISKLGAITGATSEQLMQMRNVARDLGATTEFSATQAADGLTFLGMAGFTAAESMASIASVLDLATASGMDLAQAADTASNIMSGFGIAAEDSASVADVLAAASSRANTNVAQLGDAMSTVAPISAALGIGIEDTAAAIGVLSDAGIQGARAGTAMRGVLAALAGPTAEAERVLNQLGLTIQDIDPATNSLSTVMQRLGDAGLETADAMTIFGREAASGALVLVDGAQRLGEFGDQLRNVDGAASDMAATMRDNLGGDIDGLVSAVQGLMISLGDAGLTAILRVVVQAVTAVTRAVSGMIDAFAGIPAAVRGFLGVQEGMSTATDNVTLAMGDEIAQANALFALMGDGNVMTQSAALAKLSEAEAHLRNADAMRQEAQAMIEVQQAQLSVDYQQRLDALRSIREGSPAYEELEQSITVVLQRMADLSAIQQGTNEGFAEAQAEVERIREAIANAVDGMVVFDGELVTAVDLTDRLAVAAGGVSFDSAAGSAQNLAEWLGISLSRALALSQVTPAMSDEDAIMGMQVIPDAAARERNRQAVRSFESLTATPSIGGGGGRSRRASGGGGGQSAAQREFNNLQREAQRIIDGTRTAVENLNVELADLAELNEMGFFKDAPEAYAKAVAALNDEIENARLEESGLGDFLEQLAAVPFAAGNAGDAFKAMLQRMVLDLAQSNLTNLLKQVLGTGGAGEGVGNIITSGLKLLGLSGARADGGPVGGGKTYLVGERGPELFTPNTSGAIVSNEDMRAGMGGGVLQIMLDDRLIASMQSENLQQMIKVTSVSAKRQRETLGGQVSGFNMRGTTR